jgi:hypothetical protein
VTKDHVSEHEDSWLTTADSKYRAKCTSQQITPTTLRGCLCRGRLVEGRSDGLLFLPRYIARKPDVSSFHHRFTAMADRWEHAYRQNWNADFRGARIPNDNWMALQA